MPPDGTSAHSAADRFWDRFVARLSKQGISETEACWYVIRAEQYLKAFSGKHLAAHTADDVAGYLASVDQLGRLTDGQFRQVVNAIQNLFLTAGVASAADVDWDFWRDPARSLPLDHPILAREDNLPKDLLKGTSGVRFKEKRNPASFLDAVRQVHAPVLERLVAEIRRRQYSIRTEQVYEAWVCRFIRFCGNRNPNDVGAEHIVAFLEELAVHGKVSASTQNQALNALVFLYKQVLGRPLEELNNFTRAKRPKRLPVVLDRVEVRRLLEQLVAGRRPSTWTLQWRPLCGVSSTALGTLRHADYLDRGWGALSSQPRGPTA